MRIAGFGHALYGIAVAGLAMLSLAYGNFAPIVERFPASLPWPEAWAYGSGAILLAASAWIVASSLRSTPWGFAPGQPTIRRRRSGSLGVSPVLS